MVRGGLPGFGVDREEKKTQKTRGGNNKKTEKTQKKRKTGETQKKTGKTQKKEKTHTQKKGGIEKQTHEDQQKINKKSQQPTGETKPDWAALRCCLLIKNELRAKIACPQGVLMRMGRAPCWGLK